MARDVRNRPSRAAWLGLTLSALFVAGGSGGCGGGKAAFPTPLNMAGQAGVDVYAALPPDLQTPDIPVLFWTDRALEREGREITFGTARGEGAVFGTARIGLGREMAWEQVVRTSVTPQRDLPSDPEIERIDVAGRITPLKQRLRVVDDRIFYPPESTDRLEADLAKFDASLEPWLAEGDGNTAVIFVHGFHVTFDNALKWLAMAWHAAGRQGVPILFSWPAGFGGFKPLAYNHDRESGELSVGHLRLLIYALARNPRIERINIVAHSRGTDVLTTALREIRSELSGMRGMSLFDQLYAEAATTLPANVLSDGAAAIRPALQAKADVYRALKLDTIVLASADIDLEVFSERFIVEQGVDVANRFIIYSSPDDGALLISRLYFRDRKRLGQTTMGDFDPKVRELIGALPGVEHVEVRIPYHDTHAYLFHHPAGLADLIAAVRDDGPAGASHGRPLKRVGDGFWRLDETYLAPAPD